MAYTTYKRPKFVSFICVLGFISMIFSMPSIFSPDVRKLGDFFPALLGLFIALRFIAFVGVWHMKRWGVELFLYTFLANTGVMILIENVSPVGTALSITTIGILMFFYRKMDRNL